MSKANKPPADAPQPAAAPATEAASTPVAPAAPVQAPVPPALAEPPKPRLCAPSDRASGGLKRFKVYGNRPRVYILAASADEAKALFGDVVTLIVELPD